MAVQVASITARLKADIKDFDAKMGKAERRLQGVEGAGKRTGGALGKLGPIAATAAAAAAAGAAAFAVKSVTAFSAFEKGMKEVFTLLPGISADAMGQMEQQVKDLSIEMGILPEKTIPALYQALSAGVPQDNVFEFMKVASKASVGGVVELETAVDGITSTINAYGAANMTAGQASDVMFTTVRLGKTTFDELSRSLFQINPVAAGLGVKFEEVGAAMAALTAQGVPTRVAATQIRQALVELGKEGTTAADAFKQLSGKSFTEFIKAGGTVKQAFDIMSKGAAGMGKGVGDLFGSVEAGMAVIALTSESGARSFGDAMAQMQNSSGATEKAFKTMDQGIARSVDKLKAKFAVLMIETGERLAPAVLTLVDAADDLLPALEGVAGVAADVIVEISGMAVAVADAVKMVKGFTVTSEKGEESSTLFGTAINFVGKAAIFASPAVYAMRGATETWGKVAEWAKGPTSNLSAELLASKRAHGQAAAAAMHGGETLDAVMTGPYVAFREGMVAWQQTNEETTAASAAAYEDWKLRAITANQEAEEAIRTAVDNTVTVFGGMPEKIKVSTDEIIKNLLAQREMAAQYESNMRILAKAGLDGLVGELQDGTPEAMAAAAAFAKDLDAAYQANLLLEPITRAELDSLAGIETDSLEQAGINWATAINNAYQRTIDLTPQPPPSSSSSSGGGGGGGGGGGNNAVLHDGGIVPGPRGQEVLAVLQAGETVIPLSGSGGGGSIYINVEGSVITERKLETVVAEAVARRSRRSGR